MPLLDQLSPGQIALALTALGLGAFVQGAVGFAFGLIATPLLIWAGLTLPVAVALLGTTVLVQTAAGCWRFRDAIVWRDLPGMMAGRTLGVPLGLVAMGWLTAGGALLMKQAVGVVVLAMAALIVALRPTPRERVSPWWVPPVGLSSGVLSGTTGMGGPPLVLWTVSHNWSTRRTRACLWALFLQLMPVQLGLMAWKFGPDVGWAVLGGLAATPLVVLAGNAGAALGSRWSRRRMRAVTLVLLAVLGAVSVAGPWLG